MPIKILIVDDDADQRDFLAVFLKLEGYKVEIAQDGGEAIRQVKSNCPDLIISDIDMPDIDGITMVKMLRELPECNEVPILTLSGYNTGNLKLAMHAGASQALRKPVEMDSLLGTIQSLLN